MQDFEVHWRTAVRFRHASRELEPLLRAVFAAFEDPAALTAALERALLFLSSEAGRTDANCSVTDQFITSAEPIWQGVTGPLRGILEDMSGTLHDSIHATNIARTFEATPEQLLARLRAVSDGSS